jgi:hypothetical protein
VVAQWTVFVLLISFAGCAASIEDLDTPDPRDAGQASPDAEDGGAPSDVGLRDVGPRDTGVRDAAAPDAALTWLPRTTCPLEGEATSVNSAVRATFPLEVVLDVGAGGLAVACDGAPVPGTTTYDARDVIFTPDVPLPIGASCTATVLPGLRDAVVGLALEGSWSFTVDAERRDTFAVTSVETIPRAAAQPSFVSLRGPGAVVSLASPLGMSAARTTDDGRRWSIATPRTSPPMDPTHYALAADARAVHAVWRSSPAMPEGVLWYSRWDQGRAGFDVGSQVNTPTPDVWVDSPSIGVTPSGAPIVLWSQPCANLVPPCPEEHTGLFARTATQPPQRVAPSTASEPTLVQTGTRTIAVWLDADGVLSVHDALDGFRPLGRGPAVAPPLVVRAIPSGELLLERDDAWMLIAIDGTPLSSWQPLHDPAQSTWGVLGFHGARRLWRLDLVAPDRLVPRVSLRRSEDLGESYDAPLPLVPFPDADALTTDLRLDVVNEHTTLLAWRGAVGRATVRGPCR